MENNLQGEPDDRENEGKPYPQTTYQFPDQKVVKRHEGQDDKTNKESPVDQRKEEEKKGGTLVSISKGSSVSSYGKRRVMRKSSSCPPPKRDASPITKGGINRLKEIARLGTQLPVEKGKSREIEIVETTKEDSDMEIEQVGDDALPALMVEPADKHQHNHDMQICEERITESTQQIIDLCHMLEQEEEQDKSLRFGLVSDAVQKWCSNMVPARKESIIHLGEKFLKDLNSTICYLAVAYRILSKACWTRPMICIDVRQAAMYAISKGWFVKCDNFKHYPFTRAEFAIAAGSYLGHIPAGKPEDPFYALKVVIDALPEQCSQLFSKGTARCVHCGAFCEVSIPSVTSRINWAMRDWKGLEQMLESSDPIPWMHVTGWHKETCNRSDHIANVNKWGQWVLTEFCVSDLMQLPTLQDTLHKQWNSELQSETTHIGGFICSEIDPASDAPLHYWFVETEPHKPPFVYDSLQGLHQLTQELAKKLKVYGALLHCEQRFPAVLRTDQLDEVAGVVPARLRTSKTIKVVGRQQAEKIRSFLYKEHGVRKKKSTRNYASTAKKEINPKGSSDLNNQNSKVKVHQGGLSKTTRSRSMNNRLSGKSNFKQCPTKHNQKNNPERKGSTPDQGKLSALFQRQQEVRRAIQTPIPDDPIEDPIEEVSDADPTTPTRKRSNCNEEHITRGDEKEKMQAEEDKHSTVLFGKADSTDLLGFHGPDWHVETKAGDTVKPTTETCNLSLPRSTSLQNVNQRAVKNFSGVNGVVAIASPHKHKRGKDRVPDCLANIPQGQQNKLPQSRVNKASSFTTGTDGGADSKLGASDELHTGLNSRAKKQKAQEAGEEKGTNKTPEGFPTKSTLDGNSDPIKDKKSNPNDTPSLRQPKVGLATPGLGGYGVISLFDGVSSVVHTLKQKLNRSPTVVVLAENDEKLRALVCAEYGYRADQGWCYTSDGAAAIYVKDVNKLLEKECKILREAAATFPNLRWFIVGGSPCQDLTFAGPSQGVLGLVGAQSRLFFTLLCVIRSMQILVGVHLVRFLVENAGSMKPYHFNVFCKLLGLETNEVKHFLWDLIKLTPYITRKRIFFRNFDDVEQTTPLPNFFDKGCGPLLTFEGKIIPLAPLLRTRGCSNFGICHSSWTLYQPHALVWDYSFWGGENNFAQACRIQTGKIPMLGWDRIVPPPFLDAWRNFINLLKKGNKKAKAFDEAIMPLLPLFNCDSYRVPFRVLNEQEVMNLAGLGHYWQNTQLDDSERLTEQTIRDMCGNSFHPKLIASALGSNQVLTEWIDGRAIGPSNLVADQQQVYAEYSKLCEVVEKEAQRNRHRQGNGCERTS